MLHVTNGEVVAELLRTTGLPGAIVEWADTLHEGPVPSGVDDGRLDEIRAEFVAAAGWASYEAALQRFRSRRETLAREGDEVVLWFEHDLFDQLQVIQVLDALARAAEPPRTVSLVCPGVYLGQLTAGQLAALFPTRERLGAEAFALATRAWAAFRAPDPRALEQLARASSEPLEHLAPALRRHLEELPSLGSGLSRTEGQIVELVAAGVRDRHELFRRNAALEEAIYLGDTVFFLILERLERAGVLRDDGAISLTDFGERLASGQADLARESGICRWVGGVRFDGRDARWRWDGRQRRLLDVSAKER